MSFTQEDKKNVLDNMEKILYKIVFFMYSTKGYPVGMSIEGINNYSSDAARLHFCLEFFEDNKKWCLKNGISSVHYNDMRIKDFIK